MEMICLLGVTVARQNGEAVLRRERHDRCRLREKVWLDYHRLIASRTHGRKRFFKLARTVNHHRMELKP
jgi:uncharacterized protein YifE (UPF0438 family)